MVQLIEFTVLASILLGAVILFGVLWKTLQDRQKGEPSTDERQERINGKAARYSMLTTVYTIVGINAYYWLLMVIFDTPFDPLVVISLLVVIFVMTASFVGFRRFFNREGDAE